MNQPVPNVTQEDVERIVRRDYPLEQFDQVIGILNQYQSTQSPSGGARVKLAVLKLADRDLNKIPQYVDIANSDYRDVLSPAEYPFYDYKTYMLPDAEKEIIIKKDWKQYQEWLTR